MDSINKIKEDAAYISKGIEEISKKISQLSTNEQCNGGASMDNLQQYLVDFTTLDEEIKALLDVTRANIYHDKQILIESRTASNEIEKEIASMEKMFNVSVSDDSQSLLAAESKSFDDTNKSAVGYENNTLTDSKSDLLAVRELLNQPFPKLL